LPTAKPRTRSPFYSAPRRLFLIPSALVAAPALQRKGNPPRCQAARPGPLQRNSLITGWSPTGRKSCTLADRYRHALRQTDGEYGFQQRFDKILDRKELMKDYVLITQASRPERSAK